MSERKDILRFYANDCPIFTRRSSLPMMQCSMRSHILFPGILAPFLLSADISSRVVFYTKSTETRGGEQNTGCLSFTRANRSVHGLGK